MYELIEGGDLTGFIQEMHQQGKLTPKLAAQIIQRLASIVAFAHRLDPPLVHRDLKPANVLLRGGEGNKIRPVVADFGIGGLAARQSIQEQASRRSIRSHTLPTAVRGAYTPLYASPQQVQGAPPDPRDDVHALGVIWYQLVTGDLKLMSIPSDWQDVVEERGMGQEQVRLLASCLASRTEKRLANAADLTERLTALREQETGRVAAEQERREQEEAAQQRENEERILREWAAERKREEKRQRREEEARLAVEKERREWEEAARRREEEAERLLRKQAKAHRNKAGQEEIREQNAEPRRQRQERLHEQDRRAKQNRLVALIVCAGLFLFCCPMLMLGRFVDSISQAPNKPVPVNKPTAQQIEHEARARLEEEKKNRPAVLVAKTTLDWMEVTRKSGKDLQKLGGQIVEVRGPVYNAGGSTIFLRKSTSGSVALKAIMIYKDECDEVKVGQSIVLVGEFVMKVGGPQLLNARLKK